MTLRSVDLALQTLDILAFRDDVGVSELGKRLGVAASTAHRLLSTMEARDFVTKDPQTRRYSLGSRAKAQREEFIIYMFAKHVVDRISELTGQTSHIGVLSGDHVRFLYARVPGPPAQIESRVNVDMQAHVVASGKAMLALLDKRQINQLYPGDTLPSPTPSAARTKAALSRELMWSRMHGYARNIQEAEVGINAIAMGAKFGNSYLSLSVSGPKDRFVLERESVEREKRLVSVLQKADDVLRGRMQFAL